MRRRRRASKRARARATHGLRRGRALRGRPTSSTRRASLYVGIATSEHEAGGDVVSGAGEREEHGRVGAACLLERATGPNGVVERDSRACVEPKTSGPSRARAVAPREATVRRRRGCDECESSSRDAARRRGVQGSHVDAGTTSTKLFSEPSAKRTVPRSTVPSAETPRTFCNTAPSSTVPAATSPARCACPTPP